MLSEKGNDRRAVVPLESKHPYLHASSTTGILSLCVTARTATILRAE
jgi:hypothetical protein